MTNSTAKPSSDVVNTVVDLILNSGMPQKSLMKEIVEVLDSRVSNMEDKKLYKEVLNALSQNVTPQQSQKSSGCQYVGGNKKGYLKGNTLDSPDTSNSRFDSKKNKAKNINKNSFNSANAKIQPKKTSPPETEKQNSSHRKYIVANCEPGEEMQLHIIEQNKDNFVCLTININNESMKAQYNSLIGDLAASCEQEPPCPNKVGQIMAVKLSEEGAWYRALFTSEKRWALIDDGRSVMPAEVCKTVQCPLKFRTIPEFCCLLNLSGKTIKVDVTYNLKVNSKDASTGVLSVQLSNKEHGIQVVGKIQLWSFDLTDTVMKQDQIDGSVPDASQAKVPALWKSVLDTCNVGDKWRIQPIVSKNNEQICLVMDLNNAEMNNLYKSLFNELAACCEPQTSSSIIEGQLMVVKLSDGFWYRGVHDVNEWILIDDGNTVTEKTVQKIVQCPDKYKSIPAFCCVLRKAGHLEIKALYDFQVLGRLEYSESLQVKIWNSMSEFEGYLKPLKLKEKTPESKDVSQHPIYETNIPKLDIGKGSDVYLVNFIKFNLMYLRLADYESDRKYMKFIDDLSVYGLSAPALKNIPCPGQVVLAKCPKEQYLSRAVVRDHSYHNNTFELVFDSGEMVAMHLEQLIVPPTWICKQPFPLCCSLDLPNKPRITPSCKKYVERLITKKVLLQCVNILPAVQLKEKDSLQNVNNKVLDLCTPEWKKLIQRGESILNCPVLQDKDIESMPLVSGQKVRVTSIDTLPIKNIICAPIDDSFEIQLKQLTTQITEYCLYIEDPYMPRVGELCIYESNKNDCWQRASVLDVTNENVKVFSLDYGYLETINFKCIKKMLEEFVKPLPALCSLCQLDEYSIWDKDAMDKVKKAVEDQSFEITLEKVKFESSGSYLIQIKGLNLKI